MTSRIQYRFLGSIPNQDEIEDEIEQAMASKSNPVRQRRTGFIRNSADKDKVELGVPPHKGFQTFSAEGDSELIVEIPPEDPFLDFKTDDPPNKSEFTSKDAGNSIIEVNNGEKVEEIIPTQPAVVGVPPSKDSSPDFTTEDAAPSVIFNEEEEQEEEKPKVEKPKEPAKVGVPPSYSDVDLESYLDFTTNDPPVVQEFMSKDAADSIIEVDEETPAVASPLMGSSQSNSKSTENSLHNIDRISVEYFGLGAMVGIGLAAMILFRIGRRRRRFLRERRRRKTFNHYDDTIKFRDEYDDSDGEWGSTDDSTHYDPEGIHYIEKQPLSFDSEGFDWLGGIGFDGDDDGSCIDENMNDLDESSCYSSDYSSEYSNEHSEGNNSLEDLLNNESSNVDEEDFKLNFNDLPSMSPQVKRPTVPQLFQETLSSHWNQAKQGLLPLSNDNEDSNNSTFCELQQEQEELNKFIFTLNDSILEKQRELDAAAKTLTQKITRKRHKETFVQHKKISKEIHRLEEEKEDVDAKLKSVRSKIKGHRLERRRRLFLENE